MEDFKVNCHAVLTSGGGSLSERQFLNDYSSLIGEAIPFPNPRQRDLRSLLESLDGEFYFTKSRGETIINHVDRNTAHISSLIARQKSKPKSRGRGRSSSALLRPRLPQRLNSLRAPSCSPAFTPRSPPKSRYGNPPIIPQRQPLSSAQQRPVQVNGSASSSVQERLSRVTTGKEGQHVTLNRKEAESRIMSIPPVDRRSSADSSNKDSSLIEVLSEDATFVDIQWLQGKVFTTNGRMETGSGVRTCATRQSSACQQTSPPAVAKVQSPPKMSATTASPPPLMSLPLVQPVKSPPPLMSVPVVRPVKSRTRSVNQKVVFTSHVEELSNLALKLGFECPDYSSIERVTRGKRVFMGKVKIVKDGKDLIFSSYPDEKATCEEAQECVAKLACEALTEKHVGSDNSSPEPLDDLLIIERVADIVRNKPNGMIHNAIAQSFREIHKLALPPSWLSIIEQSQQLSVEWFNKQTAIVYPGKDVYNSDDAGVQSNGMSQNLHPPLSPGSSDVPSCTDSDIKCAKQKKDINANTLPSDYLSWKDQNGLRTTCVDMPPKLDLPKECMWDVFVSSVSLSQHKVWIRLIGDQYDKVYNEMMNDLEMSLLSSPGQKVQNPQVNSYYAVKFDACWCRVKLLEINENGEEQTAEVFLLDNGEEDTIPLDDLRVLHDDYLKIPPQALQCRLAYIDLSFDEAQAYMLAHVIGSSFVAEVFVQQPAEDATPCIILHNTEVENKPVNVNIQILNQIIENMRPPQLPQKGGIAFMKLCHIGIETPPFVQLKGRDLEFLENILQDVSRQDLVAMHGVHAHPKPAHLSVHDDHMFLVRSAAAPEEWRRGIIVGMDDARHPLVHLVDHGYQESIMISSIFDIEKVIAPLTKYPKQAVQVNLSNIIPSQLVFGVVARVHELAPPQQYIMGKVIDIGSSESLPAVEFYKRVQPDNMIVSINHDLLFNYEEYSKIVVEEKKIITDQAGLSHEKGLQQVQINGLPDFKPPMESEFFDVFCSMSSHPFNFIVQPIELLNSSFNKMMKEMQDLYESQYRVMPTPPLQDLKESSVVAVKHPEDLQWYRGSIVTTISDDMVSIRYCDYGEVGLVALDRLRYLEHRFTGIPALAIKAQLHGVKPKNGDWSVVESLAFNKLVQNKAFVSKVKEVNSDGASNTWRVSLQLIDTTREEVDVDIADLLIVKGLAVRI